MSDPTSRSSARQRPVDVWASGPVTSTGRSAPPPSAPSTPPSGPQSALPSERPAAPPEPPAPDGPQRRRRQLLIFAGVAGVILAAGLAVLLTVALTTDGGPFRDRAPAAADLRPPLAKACPPPTALPSGPAAPAPGTPPPASGPRTVDAEAGISYRAYGAPWIPWTQVWRAGSLRVPYKTGQHIVTEVYSGGSYHASILSAAVPTGDNDAVTMDLECVGRQVAADVRAGYYPQPNTMEPLRDEMTRLGGRPAWVSKFRLRFQQSGLTATEELAAVAVIDVGKPSAAILYVSIPGTHKQHDHVVDEVLNSVRPTA